MLFDLMPVVSTATKTSTVSGGVGGGVGFGPTVSVSGGKPALPPSPPVVFSLGSSSSTVGESSSTTVPSPSPPVNFLFKFGKLCAIVASACSKDEMR